MDFINQYKIPIIIGVVVVILITIYNTMLKKRNKVKTVFSSLDVMLKKRYDLMPNLVSMVQKYMTHESDLLTRLTELRVKAQNTNSIDESIEINNQIDDTMRKLNVSVEGYPDLKSNQNFLHMQAVLNDVEEQISAARRTYNAHVESYNNFVGMIPMNIFAFIFRFKQYKLFEIAENERESKIWM